MRGGDVDPEPLQRGCELCRRARGVVGHEGQRDTARGPAPQRLDRLGDRGLAGARPRRRGPRSPPGSARSLVRPGGADGARGGVELARKAAREMRRAAEAGAVGDLGNRQAAPAVRHQQLVGGLQAAAAQEARDGLAVIGEQGVEMAARDPRRAGDAARRQLGIGQVAFDVVDRSAAACGCARGGWPGRSPLPRPASAR